LYWFIDDDDDDESELLSGMVLMIQGNTELAPTG
jgi:hypothetical protein